MKYFVCIFSILLSVGSFSYDLGRNPIYHSMLILNKKIDREKAYRYSNIVSSYSRAYGVDPFLVVAIMRQESRIKLGVTREVQDSEITYNPETKKFTKTIEVTDFCMMQIHKSNVINKNLNAEKLLEDPDYCIHEGMKILKSFKYLATQDLYWWTRYNAFDPVKREIYKNNVLRHYNKLTEKIPNFKKVKVSYIGNHSAYAVMLATSEEGLRKQYYD